ncbi:MAG: ABC transporter permease subunit [Dehalococcoidia bacterium]|nr:ABC transporter permease subunit [Dehalococcoidia bacterium]
MAAGTKALPIPTRSPFASPSGLGRSLVRFARRKPLGAVSALFLLGFVTMALLAPVFATHDPREFGLETFASPSSAHFFGTDQYGRDIFSRVVYGSRLSLTISLTAVLLGTTVGSLVGIASAYIGGRTDMIIQRFVDAMLSFPGLIFAIALVGLVGPSIKNVAIAIGIVTAPSLSRVVRGPVMSIKQNVYIEAAQSLGAGQTRIMLRHVLPNVMAIILVLATARLGAAILIESGLSFLGLGPSPDTPTWGQMLSGEALYVMEVAWWLAVFPGVAITLVVLAFNLLGDSLRDIFDPHLRGR